MAGVSFSFFNFSALIQLNIGIADRLDDNRSENFAIVFCDLSKIEHNTIEANLENLLRTSDSIVHYENYYFFILPYTDRYGTKIVTKMVEELFSAPIPSSAVCYPINGENPLELLESLHAEVKKMHQIDLDCLYSAINKHP